MLGLLEVWMFARSQDCITPPWRSSVISELTRVRMTAGEEHLHVCDGDRLKVLVKPNRDLKLLKLYNFVVWYVVWCYHIKN